MTTAAVNNVIHAVDAIKKKIVLGGMSKSDKIDVAEARRLRYLNKVVVIKRKTYKKGGEPDSDDDADDDADTSGVTKTKTDEPEKEAEADAEDLGIEEDPEDEGETAEDVIIAKLNALADMDELTQMASGENPLERWQQCCAFFGLDWKQTGKNERVTLAGLKTPLYQYQAFGIFW